MLIFRRLGATIGALAISTILFSAVHAESADAGKIRVVAGIEPVAYFVDRLGAPFVNVSLLVGAGQDPHTFEPTPKLISALARAQLVFTLGFPFEESLIRKVGENFRNARIVDLQKGINLRPPAPAEKDGHHHGHKDGHDHSGDIDGLDRHTWLDPKLAMIQAQTIAEALIEIDPEHKTHYENNLKAFLSDLNTLDRELSEALAGVRGKVFYAFHPAYGYFGDSYGLKQVAVQFEGKEPTARRLARLVEQAKRDGVKVVFVQPQFSGKTAETLARSIDGTVVSMDPLAADYLRNLRDMAAKLSSGLKNQKD